MYIVSNIPNLLNPPPNPIPPPIPPPSNPPPSNPPPNPYCPNDKAVLRATQRARKAAMTFMFDVVCV